MIVHKALVIVLLCGAPAVSKVVDSSVSINSKTVYVKGPDKITVDGFAAKLGSPGTSKANGGRTQYTFVGQMKKDGMQTSIGSISSHLTHSASTNVYWKRKRKPLRQKWKVPSNNHVVVKPYRTPYIPIRPFNRHRQPVKRTTTTSSPKLPECTNQQVCNALYLRLNRTQNLCSCSSGIHDTCSASSNPNDGHSVRLIADNTGKVLTMVKTCEPIAEVRVCKAPTDWALLAIQNMRTAKAHYLVICTCPKESRLYGPTLHPNPSYAEVPGISMHGMLCVSRAGRSMGNGGNTKPELPWSQIRRFIHYLGWSDVPP